MRRSGSRFAPWAALAVATLLSPPAPAGADEPPAAPGTSVYKNDALGVKLTGPSGWKMATSKAMPSQWSPLVTFYDPPTDAEATLHVRPRRSGTVQDLRQALQKEWSSDRAFTVVATRDIEPTVKNPLAGIVFEATAVDAPPAKPAPKAGTPPAPPAPAAPAAPTTTYVMATYWLGPGYEYLLYAKARSTLWSRMRPFVEAIRDSFVVAGGARGPEGEGGYRDEARGFSCRFPKGYAVLLPARKDQMVEFTGVSADQPVIAVFHLVSNASVEDDAQALVTRYTEELGGEATAAPFQVAASPGMMVTARANVDGKDQTHFVAIARRGGDLFRIRGAVPRAGEGDGKRVFETFLGTVTLGTPKPVEGE